MKALQLEAPEQLVVREIPEPLPGEYDALIQVGAVGVCGTDFHIYSGGANYNSGPEGRPIPLSEQPQILGHEFCGTVLEVGGSVEGLKPGDRVAVDQGLNCYSLRILPVCEYCRSGDSHQCENYQERGITGLAGARQELVTMPAMNCILVSRELSARETVLSEPLGCIIHSIDRAVSTTARYTFSAESGQPETIQNILILGAGPAGLFFLQYLRKVRRFEGRILVADRVEENLSLVERFGGTPLNPTQVDLAEAVRELTDGRKIHFLIEATGSGVVFETIPTLLRKQATMVLYGHGHKGTDLSVLNRLLFLEPTLVVSVGASGRIDENTGQPATTSRAVELIQSGQIEVEPIISHEYRSLEEVRQAFEFDSKRQDYIKGVLAYE